MARASTDLVPGLDTVRMVPRIASLPGLSSSSEQGRDPLALFLHTRQGGSSSAPPTPAPAPPAGPSSVRSIDRQSARSLRRASTDSLIQSLAPEATVSKGKGKADSQLPPPAMQAVGPIAVVPPAPKESNSSAIKRIDANVATVTDNLSSLLQYFDEQRLTDIKRATALADTVSELAVALEKIGENSFPSVATPSTSQQADINDLIHANNVMVEAVTALRGDMKVNAASLESLREFVGDMGNAFAAPNVDHTGLIPATKRARIGPTISTLIPDAAHAATSPIPNQPALMLPAHSPVYLPPPVAIQPRGLQVPTQHGNGGALPPPPPPPAPAAPVPPPAGLTPASPNTVTFGPITWGRNITVEFKNFQTVLPGGASLRTSGVRAHSRSGDYVCVTFPSTADMDRFMHGWATSRPAEYVNVHASKNA
jgi:hypothetical protein